MRTTLPSRGLRTPATGALTLAVFLLAMAAFGKRWYQLPYKERIREENERYGWSGGWRPVQRRDRIAGTVMGVPLLGFAVAVFIGRYDEWAAYWPERADEPFGDVLTRPRSTSTAP